MDTREIPIWLWQRDTGTWLEVWVPPEHYERVAALARGRNGDQTISLVPMPERQRAVG